MTPIPVGTVVDYHGSHQQGRYVVTEHQAPRPGTPDPEVNYPDGVAYVIWPEGVEVAFRHRDRAVAQVRRQSLTVAAP